MARDLKSILTAIDATAAHELELYADNESRLYPQKQAIIENLKKKLRKGVYDPELAVKLWLYWIDAAAKRYSREFSTGRDWNALFTKATRVAVARSVERRERQMLQSGEYGNGRESNPIRCRGSPAMPRYSAVAVAKAIDSSRRSGRPIGRKEAKLIHRLLKGRYSP